jgi:hypothetical protein
MRTPMSAEERKRRRAAKMRRWRAKNPEKSREHSRRTYAKYREQYCESQRQRHADNREARNLRSRQAHAAKLEVRKAAQQQWRNCNREALRARDRQRWAANREALSARLRQRRATSPEAFRAWERQWYAAHPEKRRAKNLNSRARRRTASVVGAVNPKEIFERDGGRCYLCRGAVDAKTWHLDHLRPLVPAEGHTDGEHAWFNVAVACKPCNLRKSNRRLPEAEALRERLLAEWRASNPAAA